MTHRQARLVAELEATAAEAHNHVKELLEQAAAEIAQLVADLDAIRSMGSDHG